MGDEGMDPCECIFSQEMAMHRLLSLLRQGQSYCTDSECLEELPGGNIVGSGGNCFLMMFMTVAFAVAMYAWRPRRDRVLEAEKTIPNANDNDGPPPTPPRI